MTEEERREAARRRTARYRANKKAREEAHEKGDHSGCRPAECEEVRAAAGDADADVTGDVTPTSKNSVSHREPPADLGERGRRLWVEMAGLKLGPTHVALLERACRKLDRLELMDQLIRDRSWGDDAAAVFREVRQTEIAFKLDVSELRHAGRPADAAGRTPPAADDPVESSGVKEGAAGGNVTSISAIRGSAGS